MRKAFLTLLFVLMATLAFAQDAAAPAPLVDSGAIPVAGIVVDKNKLTLYAGNTATALKASITPPEATDKLVLWTSSDPAVAAVDESGAVTPLAVGMVTVTATTHDGDIAFDVSVEVKENVPVTAVVLDKNAYSLALGVGSLQLHASLVPTNGSAGGLVWSTDSALVATVDQNGKVIARAPGRAKITVTTADGAFQTYCMVEVKRDYTAVQSVVLDKETYSINAGGPTVKLVAKVLPEGATYKEIEWSSSDATVATVDKDGLVLALNPGTTVVTATTKDGKKAVSAALVVNLFAASSKVKLDKEVLDLLLYRDVSGSLDFMHQNSATDRLSRVNGPAVLLKATVEADNGANQYVTWKSSDPKVALVSSEGLVTPVSVGTAYVSATAEDGAVCVATVRIKLADPQPKAEVKAALSGSASVIFGSDLDSGNVALANRNELKLAVGQLTAGEASSSTDKPIYGEIRIYTTDSAVGSTTEAVQNSGESLGLSLGSLKLDYARVVFAQYGYLQVTPPNTQIAYTATPDMADSFMAAETSVRYGGNMVRDGYFAAIPSLTDAQGTDASNGLALALRVPGAAGIKVDFGSLDAWNDGKDLAQNTAQKFKSNWGFKVQLVQDFLRDLTLELGLSGGITINDQNPNVKTAFGGKVGYRFGLVDQLYLNPSIGVTMVGIESNAKTTTLAPAIAGGLLLGWSEKWDWSPSQPAVDAVSPYPGLSVGVKYIAKTLSETPKDLISMNVSLFTGPLLGPVSANAAFEVKDLNADKLEFGFSGGLSADLRFESIVISPRVVYTHKEVTATKSKSYEFLRAGLEIDGLVPFVVIGVNYASNDLLNGFQGNLEEKQGKLEVGIKVKF